MRSLFPLVFSLIAITLFGLLEILLLRFLNKSWWQKKWIRRSAWLLPLVGDTMVCLWFVGELKTLDWLSYSAAGMAMLAFVLEVSLMMSLPLSGIVHLVQKILDRFSKRSEEKPEEHINKTRRMILQGAAAALPIVTMSSGVTGMSSAFTEANVYLRKMKFARLPEDLYGFRILHLSDLHLRRHVTVADLESVLTRAKDFNPDLILVTGDIADDLAQLPETISLIEQFKAPHGAFATFGNHEYFRGPERVKRTFEKTNTPLFVDQGTSLRIGDATLFIGGIDDPRNMGAKDLNFFEQTISKTMEQSSGYDFAVLMSHRPDALDIASEKGIDLVLAGHTHGGQIGLMGRSVFEPIWPDRYLWGEYRRKETQLYTTSGMGHWFPFRLNCPTEAPVIELSHA